MKRSLILLGSFLLVSQLGLIAQMQLSVDATQMHRSLLKTVAHYPVEEGPLELYYPEWIPGIHGPKGPIENVAEIAMFDGEGNRLKWNRHPHDVFRFQVEIPQGVTQLKVALTYVCNQPSVNSRGIDSYGNTYLAIINWNTCLLYPEYFDIHQNTVKATLDLPQGWNVGSSMAVEGENERRVTFEEVSLIGLIDAPLIAGEFLRTLELATVSGHRHFIHLVSESEHAVRPKAEVLQGLNQLVEEGLAMFGRAAYEEYHFLLVLSDSIPGIGLEHLRSSLNSEPEGGLTKENLIPDTIQLLAHEFAHSWCGKHRRPAGMATKHYNEPKDTRLLWIYEGLDTYLGHILAARSDLIAKDKSSSIEQAIIGLGKSTLGQRRKASRRTMPLEDTASSAYIRRARSTNWPTLVRSQDYYREGEMLWLEIDCRLRSESDGELSLDDFCQRFLGDIDEGKEYHSFDQREVVSKLNSLVTYGWEDVIDNYVHDLQESLPLAFLTEAGYHLEYTNEKTDIDENMILTSLGLSMYGDGSVGYVVPELVGDKAGLHDGVKIIGVNGRKYSQKRFEDAIRSSVSSRLIELLTLQGDKFVEFKLEYDLGPRYFDLVRNEDETDYLTQIFSPLGGANKQE